VELKMTEPDRVGGVDDVVEGRVHEHADDLGAAPHHAGDAGGDGRVGRRAGVRPQDEAERPCPQPDRQLGVLVARDAADLDPGHPSIVGGARSAHGHGRRALAELNLNLQLASVADEIDRDPVAGPMAIEDPVDVGHGLDGSPRSR
jgi:hypothetical protein